MSKYIHGPVLNKVEQSKSTSDKTKEVETKLSAWQYYLKNKKSLLTI